MGSPLPDVQQTRKDTCTTEGTQVPAGRSSAWWGSCSGRVEAWGGWLECSMQGHSGERAQAIRTWQQLSQSLSSSNPGALGNVISVRRGKRRRLRTSLPFLPASGEAASFAPTSAFREPGIIPQICSLPLHLSDANCEGDIL